jgi:hypothetical protein
MAMVDAMAAHYGLTSAERCRELRRLYSRDKAQELMERRANRATAPAPAPPRLAPSLPDPWVPGQPAARRAEASREPRRQASVTRRANRTHAPPSEDDEPAGEGEPAPALPDGVERLLDDLGRLSVATEQARRHALDVLDLAGEHEERLRRLERDGGR